MDCKRVTVVRIGPVISTKKALYFVGSTVLFFFSAAKNGGCTALSASFSDVCRRFSAAPESLVLRQVRRCRFS